MLITCRKGFYAIAAIACLTASAALATDHDVVIIDGAYFPPLIYAEVGDRLIFLNSSNGVHTVQGPVETWTSGPIPIDGTFTLMLDQETPLTFIASVETEGTSAELGDILLEQIGQITYDPKPAGGLGVTADDLATIDG